MAVDVPGPLAPEDTARLTDFARACKAAARAVDAVSRPPPGHRHHARPHRPHHVRAGLPDHCESACLCGRLLLDDRPPAAPATRAIAELAVLLTSISSARSASTGRRRRGVAHVPAPARTNAGTRSAPRAAIARSGRQWPARHVELREIDYAKSLRERRTARPPALEQDYRQLPAGQRVRPRRGRRARTARQAAGDSELASQRPASTRARRGERPGHRQRSRGAHPHAARHHRSGLEERPHRLEPAMQNMAAAVGQCSTQHAGRR